MWFAGQFGILTCVWKDDSITGTLHIIVKWGQFGSLCLLSHCVSLTEINRTHSIPLTFNHVSLNSPVPPPAGNQWLIVRLGKGNQASAADALWAKRPWAQWSSPACGAIMTGLWCLYSKLSCLVLSRNFSFQTILTHWNHVELSLNL